MAEQIEARVIQKIATAAEWESSTLPLKKGEFAIVSDSTGKPINIRVGDGTNPFSGLVDMFDAIQQNVNFIEYSGGAALPTPTIETGYTILSEGSYTFGGSPAFTVPSGHWGTANWDGNSWTFTDLGLLPTVSITDDVNSDNTEALSSRGASDNIVKKYITYDADYLSFQLAQNEIYNSSNGNIISPFANGVRGLPQNINGGQTITIVDQDNVAITGIRIIYWDQNNVFQGSSPILTTNTFLIPSSAYSFSFNSATGTNSAGLSIYNIDRIAGFKFMGSYEISRIENLEQNQSSSNNLLSELNNKVAIIQSQITETESYNQEWLDATPGYYNLGGALGSVVSKTKNPNTGWRSKYIDIKAGMSITLRTKGGGSQARAYAIVNTLNQITESAAANTDTISTPYVKFFTEDGGLYVNCSSDSYSSFSIIIQTSINDKIDELSDKIDNSAGTLPLYFNNIYPIQNTSLKVLALGNSFTDDSTEYMQDFVNGSTLNNADICLYRATIGGSSLQTWVNAYNNNTLITLSRRAGGITMPTGNGNHTLTSILSQDWDIIIIQQLSDLASDYNSIFSSLPFLIKAFRRHCTNQKVCLGWNSIWSYTQGYNPNYYGLDAWRSICNTSIEQALKIGINFIIPTGTAIQNARLVTSPVINGGNDLTRDGYHLQYGSGRYIAAATWFYKIFGNVFNINILNNTAIHALTQFEIDTGNPYNVAVDSSNKDVCLRSAFLAVNDWTNINNPT